MKTTHALLAATTALGTLLTAVTLDAAQAGNRNAAPNAAQQFPVHLVSGDDEDDRDEDCDEAAKGDEGGDDDRDDDDETCLPTANPAAAGAIAPPANGLFGNGTPPKAQIN